MLKNAAQHISLTKHNETFIVNCPQLVFDALLTTLNDTVNVNRGKLSQLAKLKEEL